MATSKQFRKQYKKHTIVWSVTDNVYYIVKNKKKIYKAAYVKDAEGWIDRNTK